MKNFLKGYGNALTLVPPGKFPRVNINNINYPKNSYDALKRDWETVGKSLSSVMGKIGKEIENGK